MLTGDSSFQNIFCYAVDRHQAMFFSLIHGLCFKDVVATSKDIHGNTLLRMAATQAPAALLNRIYGTTLQMQRELQRFKEVERIIPPTIRIAQYRDSLIIEELFRESHKELMKEGEKWIKDTA